MIRPLTKPLEFKPTVYRACRQLGFYFTQDQMRVVGTEVCNAFNGRVKKVWEWQEIGNFKVCCYPVEFIPKMLDVIVSVKADIDAKELRLQKQKDFLERRKLKQSV